MNLKQPFIWGRGTEQKALQQWLKKYCNKESKQSKVPRSQAPLRKVCQLRISGEVVVLVKVQKTRQTSHLNLL